MKLHELNEVHQVVADDIGIYRINPDAVLETPSFFSEEQNSKYDQLMDYFISQIQKGKPIALYTRHKESPPIQCRKQRKGGQSRDGKGFPHKPQLP